MGVKMLKKYKEPMFLLGIMAFAVFMLLEANNINVGRGRNPVGPIMWPRMVLGGMFLCSAILFVIDLLRIRRGVSLEVKKDDGESASTDDIATDKTMHPSRGLYTIIFLVAYLLLMPYVGFMVSTLALMFAYLLSLRIRAGQSALIAGISTAVITFLFPYVLSVPLPKGVGVFFELTKHIY